MRIITWNVNSIRQRLPRLVALLERERPDIVCLQETKVADDLFPHDALAEEGYTAAIYGQRTYNGVAIISAKAPDEVSCGFDGDPTPGSCRVMTARFGDLSIVNAYIVNGKEVGDPAYGVKLAWLDAFTAWVGSTFDLDEQLIVCGDFNVAPDERDVHDPKRWAGKNLFTEAERTRLRALMELGLVDLLRLHHPEGGVFSYWDYRAGAFHRGWGLRIDLMLGSETVARRCTEVRVDRNERKPTAGEGAPSDHAPVIATFDD